MRLSQLRPLLIASLQRESRLSMAADADRGTVPAAVNNAALRSQSRRDCGTTMVLSHEESIQTTCGTGPIQGDPQCRAARSAGRPAVQGDLGHRATSSPVCATPPVRHLRPLLYCRGLTKRNFNRGEPTRAVPAFSDRRDKKTCFAEPGQYVESPPDHSGDRVIRHDHRPDDSSDSPPDGSRRFGTCHR